MRKGWHYRDHPSADAILAQKCDLALQNLIDSPRRVSMEIVKDTRSIHRMIFEELVDDDRKHLVGHYRGENLPDINKLIGSRRIQVFRDLYVRHQFVRPQNVLHAMEELKRRIDRLLADMDTTAQNEYYRSVVDILVQFYLIHPYFDGNGHIGRVIVTYLMSIADIQIGKSWSIHPSPFTEAIGICLFTHNKYPIIAEQYFSQWFPTDPNRTSDAVDSAESDVPYGQAYYSSSDYSGYWSYESSDSGHACSDYPDSSGTDTVAGPYENQDLQRSLEYRYGEDEYMRGDES